MYFAARWSDSGGYVAAVYNIYLNYDGNCSKYGNTNVSANTSDVEDMPVYASINGQEDFELHNYTNKQKLRLKITRQNKHNKHDEIYKSRNIWI